MNHLTASNPPASKLTASNRTAIHTAANNRTAIHSIASTRTASHFTASHPTASPTATNPTASNRPAARSLSPNREDAEMSRLEPVGGTVALMLVALFVSSCDAQGTFMGAEYRDGEWSQARQAVCLTEPPADPVCEVGEVLIPFPQGTELSDFTLLASDLLEVRDITVNGNIGSTGLADTVIFSGATVENVYSRGLLDLRSNATVTGFINTTTEISVQGSANYDPALVNINYPFEPIQTESLCFPEPGGIDQGPNVYIDVGQTETWPPGVYNNVELRNNATLELSPGNYWLDWLQVEPGSTFYVNTTGCTEHCAVVLNIRTEVENSLRGSVQPPGSDLLILYHGTEPMTLNAAFDGFIVAMNTTLQLNNDNPHSGAFFAKTLIADAGQTIAHKPFPLAAFQAQQP